MVEQTKKQFYSPKYWPTHFGLLILRVIALSPGGFRRRLGRGLGWLLGILAIKRERIARINLSLCFPSLPKNELNELVAENMKATGCGLIETSCCWFSDLKNQQAGTEIVGKHHLDDALAKGNGVILLSFHMTSLEMGGCLLGAHYDLLAMYKPAKNPLLDHVMCQGRERHIAGLLDRNNVRGTIKALKKNQIVWYAADQNYGAKTKVFVPFFNIQTATITATTKLAKMTGAAVVPFTQRRLDSPDSYQMTLYPAFDNFPGDDETTDAARINQFLEDYLNEHPIDYMWLHQRFRHRPPGEAPIY
jgi:KDO2-lipid IV(A) lauroyltransferase